MPSSTFSGDIKDILTIVDMAGDQPAAHATAEIATLTRAHATGLSLVYDLYVPSYGFGALPAEVIVEAREEALRRAGLAADAFEQIASRAGISFGSRRAEGVFFGAFDEVVSQSRLTDLVVVRRDSADAPEALRTALIEALLFNSGTPLLIVRRSRVPLRSSAPA